MAMESWLSTELGSDDLWIETGLLPGMLSLGRRGERGLGLADTSSNQATQQSEDDFLNWEEAGKRREVNTLKRLVKTAEESVLQRSQELYEKKEQEQWAEKHDLWLKELVGSRNLGGSYVDKSLVANALLLGDSADRPSLPHYVDSFQPSASNAMTYQPCDPAVVQFHFEIVKSHKGNGTFSVEARDLAKRADSVSLPGGSCYASALRLVSRILSRQHFSQEEIAFSTLSHFSNQFDQWLSGKVRSSLEGQQPVNEYRNPKANTVARFVSLQLGAGAEVSLWPCLYYCLRIGDAVAAMEVFERTPTPNENEETRAAIANILTSLSQRQGTAQTLWDVSGSFHPSKQDTRTIAEACELTEGSTDQRLSVYRSGVLSLLGCSADFPTSSLPGLSTMEDWLVGSTVMAIFHDEPVQQLEALKKQISNLGTDYFEDGDGKDSGGWSYCLPLLASQQFRTALTYLAQSGGPIGRLQATHLALFLSKGIPETVLENSEGRVTQTFVTSLLVEYATWLDGQPGFGAVGALEYLKFISAKPVLMSELVSLLVRTPDFNVLAGSLSSEGVGRRGKGALDAYFAADDISFLLQKAAEKCFHEANDRNRLLRATNLFMLSGHFRPLAEMLSSLMLPTTGIPNEENLYWHQQMQNFYSHFLTRRTYVVEVDESLPAICKQMLDIFDFYRRIQLNHHTEAWTTLDRLEIIPLSPADVAASKDRFRGLDPLFKNQVPMLLQVAMQSLRYKHAELKNQPGNEVTLRQLKDRARAILTFAGMISEDVVVPINVLARLEASLLQG